MIPRRNLIIGGLALGAAGLAEALKPRGRLTLLKGTTVAKVLPRDFGRWRAATSPGLVSPEIAGKLAASLYNEIVELTYHDEQTGNGVMLLAAYGGTQSDLLQLHRPEVCYPAVGFTLKSSAPASVRIGEGALLPVRRVVAEAGDRVENIVYWTRLGEEMPQSEDAQRMARFQNALHGFVADGILMRCSLVGEPGASFPILDAFIPALLQAVAPAGRPALLGTRLSGQMTA